MSAPMPPANLEYWAAFAASVLWKYPGLKSRWVQTPYGVLIWDSWS